MEDDLNAVEVNINSYDLLIKDLEKKHENVFLQIKKVLYHEDTEKVLDGISLFLLDHNFINFRIGRDDNMYSMQNYKKIKNFKSEEYFKQFDSSIYSTKTKVSYYFGYSFRG